MSFFYHVDKMEKFTPTYKMGQTPPGVQALIGGAIANAAANR
jgi:hypothetical protein